MTDLTLPPAASITPDAEPKPAAGGDDLDARVSAAVAAQLDKAVEARLAPLTSKYNKELAGLRKRLESRGEMPRDDVEVGDGQEPKPVAATGLTRDDLKAYAEIVKLRGSLPEDLANEIDGDEDAPFSARLSALKVAALVHAKVPKVEAEDPKKPGRDARINGSARGHSPASRSTDGYPATFEEWAALPVEKQRELRTQFPDRSARMLPRARY